MARLDALGWDIVRRPTGGKAILHTDELTYSATAMKDDPRVAGGVIESYRRLSRGLIEGLQVLGLVSEADRQAAGAHKGQGPVCFEVPSHYEITVNGQKLIGSAQVRKRGGVLQHGTLPLVGDLGRICDALAFEDEAAREAAKVRVRERAITLDAALGEHVSWADVAEALAEGFARALDVELVPGALSDVELAQAAEIREKKYGGLAWTQRR
jgi:lipoate-protein ligase A